MAEVFQGFIYFGTPDLATPWLAIKPRSAGQAPAASPRENAVDSLGFLKRSKETSKGGGGW